MKKTVITLGLFLFMAGSSFVYSQTEGAVAINHTDPKATLDIKAYNTSATGVGKDVAEGILIPRITKAKAEAIGKNSEESTLVYITDNSLTGIATYTVDVNAKGFYYMDDNGTTKKWKKVGGGASETKSARVTDDVNSLSSSDLNGFIIVPSGKSALLFDLDKLGTPSDGDTIVFANYNGYAGFSVESTSGKIASGSSLSQANPGNGLSFVYDATTDMWYSYNSY